MKQSWREAAGVLLLAALAWLGAGLAASRARPVVLNLGPNDVEYVSGFREDWERDRRTRFHWTTLFSTVRLPVHVEGPGHVLRMRVRRHFVDPAVVSVHAEGRTVGRFEIQADPHVPYRIVELPLPPLEGRDPLVLTLQSSVTTPRPLGVAIDWMEVVRIDPSARVRLPPGVRLAFVLVVLLAYALPRLAGAGRAPACAHAGVVALLGILGAWWDVLAMERIVRLGAPVYAVTGLAAWGLVSLAAVRRALGIAGETAPRRLAGGLVLVVLAALAVRLALLLHPQFYYPDVKVHALFAWQLARRGLVAFLQEFTANQFRYSLGLQNEGGHWYAFPYPPAFYILTWPLVRLASMRPEVAVSVLGAAVNSLEALVVFAIARRLGSRPATAMGAAGALVLLPIFLRRLSLAYFPALVGHAVDAIVLAYLLARLADLARLRVIVVLAALFALAMLTYTQSVLNFAVLLGLFLALQAVRDRTPGAWKRIGRAERSPPSIRRRVHDGVGLDPYAITWNSVNPAIVSCCTKSRPRLGILSCTPSANPTVAPGRRQKMIKTPFTPAPGWPATSGTNRTRTLRTPDVAPPELPMPSMRPVAAKLPSRMRRQRTKSVT